MTFNRLANIQYSRLKNKVLTDLQEPTLPIIATAFQPITEEDYLVLGEFLDTDLLNGEIAINTTSDRVWVRSDDQILELSVAGSASSLTAGSGITIGSASTIDLGGNLTSDVFFDGLTGSSSMFIGSHGPNKQLNYFSVGTNNGVGLYSYENNQISSGINLGTNVVSIGSNVQNGNVYITGNTAMVSGYDNRRISLYLYGSGIPTGSGEYFVINGVTFSENLDFIGQGDPVLDAETIAGLTYSGVPDFISLDYTIGSDSIFFNFSNPAVVSASFSSTALVENQFNTQLSLNTAGAMLVSGNNGLIINNFGEHKFNDTEPNPKGLQYAGNYDATLVDDSLVPKRYVDNAISTISLTGGSGISIGASGSIDLGGTLTQDTIINGGGYDFELGVTGSEIDFLRIKALQSQEEYKFSGSGLEVIQNPGTFKTDLDYSSTLGWRSFIEHTPSVISSVVSSNLGDDETQITQSSQQINILTKINGGAGSGFSLDQIGDSFRFTDNRITPRGLEYQNDYSANFSIRSLVDKEYVDNNISGLSFSLINDLTPQLGGNLDLNNFNIGGTGSIDIEGNVIADMVQLKGGVGTQGELSWDIDEETIALIMDGTTQHIGQDTYIHARNNTGSIITKGTACMATGTLGASGRITIAPMVADGSIEARYYIGVAAEDIGIGEDGKVSTFGKIRQIDLTNFNDGDVLWLDPTIAGGLTSSIPQAPDLKIATAFVIHAANNGTLFVRVENGTDLHNDQRVQVSGLTAGQFLGWDVANQRWENKTPSGSSLYTANGTIGSNRVATLTDTLSFSGGRVSFDTTSNGILLPRLTTAQMNAIVSPTTNLLVFNTDLNGLYRYNGSIWVPLSVGYGIVGVYSGSDTTGRPTFFATLQDAMETCKASGGYFTVKLYSNITITSSILIDYTGSGIGGAYLFRQLIIDLNGFSITNNQTDSSHCFDLRLSNSSSVYQEVRFLNGSVFRNNGTGTHRALKCDTAGRFGTIQMSKMFWYNQNSGCVVINLSPLSIAQGVDRICDFGGSTIVSQTGFGLFIDNGSTHIKNFNVIVNGSDYGVGANSGNLSYFTSENTSTGRAVSLSGTVIARYFSAFSNSGTALFINTGTATNFTCNSVTGRGIDADIANCTLDNFTSITGDNRALKVLGSFDNNSNFSNGKCINNGATVCVELQNFGSANNIEAINNGSGRGLDVLSNQGSRSEVTNCKGTSIGGIGGAISVAAAGSVANIDNCYFISHWNNSGGHALSITSTTGSILLTKSHMKVRNASANAIHATAPRTINSRYCTHNDVATTPINANVTIVASGIIS